MKTCHPDLSGNDPETTNFCTFINEVYEVVSFLDILNIIMLKKFVVSSFLTFLFQVLSDPVQRRVYDDIHGYSLTSINPFMDDSSPKDHVFVDEFSCIGTFNFQITLVMLPYMLTLFSTKYLDHWAKLNSIGRGKLSPKTCDLGRLSKHIGPSLVTTRLDREMGIDQARDTIHNYGLAPSTPGVTRVYPCTSPNHC